MMAVVEASTGRIIATPATDADTDGTTVDPVTGIAFSSNGAGTLSLVTRTASATFTVENVPTERGARTMALDAKTHRVYLITAAFNPPPPATAAQPHPRPMIVAGSFVVLAVGKEG